VSSGTRNVNLSDTGPPTSDVNAAAEGNDDRSLGGERNARRCGARAQWTPHRGCEKRREMAMKITLSVIFLIVAIVCFILQAIGVPTGKVSIGWVGMAFFAGSFLV